MKIAVTKDHIANGSTLTSWHDNPVALAMKDAGFEIPRANWVLNILSFKVGLIGQMMTMPREVQQWLVKHENKLEVQPFEFDVPLEIPND